MTKKRVSRQNRARAGRWRTLEAETLAALAEEISAGLRFEEILRRVYKSFRGLLPYDRISLALLEDKGRLVRAIAASSSSRQIHILPGYGAPLKGSSLAEILRTGQPRILNDLQAYLLEHPASESTRLIVAEGLRSSLTCPLLAQGKPIGFLFFSSRKPNAYRREHADSYLRLATLLSLSVEKGRLYEDLKEADQVKNRLLGIAAHDLRNPLSVMLGHLSLLQDDPANGAIKFELEILRRKSRQMLSMVDGLLDSSLAESKGLMLEMKALDLREFLEGICADSAILAEGKSIRIEAKLPPGLPPIAADGPRLRQTFENLISNAIKYSPPGRTVVVSARAAARGVEIAVADEGQGIPAEDLPRLFREFGRSESVRPTGGERSVGLGLSIARRIVEAHGGLIRVESEPGLGTTFTVSLPLRKAGRSKAILDLR